MQHLQPHIALYPTDFLCCNGKMLRNVESPMMILLSAYFPP